MRTSLLVALALILCASLVNAMPGTDLSEMVSRTYPMGRKCPAINGQHIYVLEEYTEAEVYFESKGGWVSGYLHGGADPNDAPDYVFGEYESEGTHNGNIGKWYTMRRHGRCGNPARGRFFVSDKTVRVPYEVPKPYPVPYPAPYPAPYAVPGNTIVVAQPVPCPAQAIVLPVGVDRVGGLEGLQGGSSATGAWQNLVSAFAAWMPEVRVEREVCPPVTPPPPPGPYCPPGTAPTPPPPESVFTFPIQPPSGQEQGGYDSGGGNAPPPQAPRIPGQPWSPSG